MKFIFLLFSLMMLITSQVLSNNIQVSNVRLTNQNTTDDFTMVEFDITWENSWRSVGSPGNWDAAWIFIKYRVGNSTWSHAWMNNTGHMVCNESLLSNGLLTPGAAFHATSNPVMGVFLYRKEIGVGAFGCNQMQLRWNYGANNVADGDVVDVQVFAIEHVYIPEDEEGFVVGSGGTEDGAFYRYPNQNSGFGISDESPIMIGPSFGMLHYFNTTGSSGDEGGTLGASYPKGYLSFYAMKYEIDQQAYINFLNTLTRTQQALRVRTNISSTSVSNPYVMSNTPNPSYRNGISCFNLIPAAPSPIIFFSNLNANGVVNEPGDGKGIACNWLLWSDLAAYLDWAALRPMTELEFEKCARGPLNPVANEYAWGNYTIYHNAAVSNGGFANEISTHPIANSSGPAYSNPVRCGSFARAGSDRTLSGAGYYGCLELSGNLWERGVTVGNPTGRSFTGLHGNGMLNAAGDADVSFWPSTNNIGSFWRGGSFNEPFIGNRISDRGVAVLSVSGNESTGGRGVRKAP